MQPFTLPVLANDFSYRKVRCKLYALRGWVVASIDALLKVTEEYPSLVPSTHVHGVCCVVLISRTGEGEIRGAKPIYTRSQ